MREIYLRPTTSQREQSHFNAFIDAFPERDSVVDPQKSEAPDFLFQFHGIRTGWELTGISREGTKPIESAQYQVLRTCSKWSRENRHHPVSVTVTFRNDINPLDIKETSQSLFKYVVEHIPDVWIESVITLSPKDIPGVSFIILSNLNPLADEIIESRWSKQHMSVGRRDPYEEILNAIKGKDQRYEKYLDKCQKCWLIISINNIQTTERFHISDKTCSMQYQTLFDRLFFLDFMEERLYELKTILSEGVLRNNAEYKELEL